MVTIPRTSFRIDARPMPHVESREPEAWLAEYLTVALNTPIEATRVGNLMGGRWYAIGDDILTGPQYQSLYSLDRKRSMKNIGLYVLPRDTLLNVGQCSGLVFDVRNRGGGIQAEMVDPSQMVRMAPDKHFTGLWGNSSGNA